MLVCPWTGYLCYLRLASDGARLAPWFKLGCFGLRVGPRTQFSARVIPKSDPNATSVQFFTLEPNPTSLTQFRLPNGIIFRENRVLLGHGSHVVVTKQGSTANLQTTVSDKSFNSAGRHLSDQRAALKALSRLQTGFGKSSVATAVHDGSPWDGVTRKCHPSHQVSRCSQLPKLGLKESDLPPLKVTD